MEQGYLWILFGCIFVGALVLDLFVLQRKAHVIPVKEALKLVGFWVSIALVFNAVIYFAQGPKKGLEFFTAYLVEYSLSIDNLFVFLAVFTYFAVPRKCQHKVLLWGILGAVFFRGIFIFTGIALIEKFHWLLYILGMMLLYTSIKLITQKENEIDPGRNPVVNFIRRFIRCDTEYHGSRFFTRINGLTCATPLLIVVMTIETMDVMFATDSIPAVFGLTLDPFIVYTSNLFAILGLRALFFAIAGLFYMFHYLAHGLSIVLFFIGVKMLLIDLVEIPVSFSLGVVAFLIAGAIAVSILFPRKAPYKLSKEETEKI